ncbi:MAG: hypothetical protein ACI9KS_002119, partial [Sulfitobacter sp.]
RWVETPKRKANQLRSFDRIALLTRHSDTVKLNPWLIPPSDS